MRWVCQRQSSERRVKFWKVSWCGDIPSREAFPELFTIVIVKDVWVAKVWESDGEGDFWNPKFTRQINDWELTRMETF